MWRSYGAKRPLKPVDPLALVNSHVKERNEKEANVGSRGNRKIIEVTKPLNTSNKSFALHQYVQDLSREDFVLRLRALRDLPDLLENPLHVEAAIHLQIVDKLAYLYRRYAKRSLVPRANEEALIIKMFLILSTYLKAAEQIASDRYVIACLYRLIQTMHAEQHVAALILKNLSEKPEVLKILVKSSQIFKCIRSIFQRELCTQYYPQDLWTHLQHVLDQCPEKGVQKQLMDTFLYRINSKMTNFHLDNMKCLALLLKCSNGKTQFQASNGIKLFYNLLSPKSIPLDSYENLLEALRNALQNNHSLIEDCVALEDFPDILLHFARNTNKEREQLYCWQILNSLNTREEIKERTVRNSMKVIIKTKTLSKECEYYKLALIYCLQRKKK